MMKVPLASFLAVLLAAGCLLAADDGAPSGPEEVARAFYAELRRHRVTGLPDGEAWTALAPYFSESLAGALEGARREQEEFRRKFPDEKPPWIEGALFSSLFEGFQTFSAKSARITGEKAEVPLDFVYTYGGDTTRWTDTLILIRKQGGWRVDDVRYGATWDFANQGTLREALAPEKDAG